MATRVALALLSVAPAARANYLALYRPTDVFSIGVDFQQGRHSSLPHSDFTMGLWLRFRSKNGDLRAFMSGYQLGFTIDNAGASEVSASLSAYLDGASYAVNMPSRVNGTEWEHFALTYVQSTRTLGFFRNGVLLGEETASGVPFSGGGTFGPGAVEVLYFGLIADYTSGTYTPIVSSTGTAAPGLFDEFALWNESLTAANVQAVYANGRDPSQVRVRASNLVIMYDMEEAANSSVLLNSGTAGATFNGVLGALPTASATTMELSCESEVTAPLRGQDPSVGVGANTAPTPLPQPTFALESTITEVELSGSDAEGQWIDTIVTALPAHGTLSVITSCNEPGGTPGEATTIAAVPFTARDLMPAYRFLYTPEANNLAAVTIGYKLVDSMGLQSAEASVAVSILEVDNVPTSTSQSYSLNEDADGVLIALGGVDTDSAHVTIVIDELPTKGSLYRCSTNAASCTPAASSRINAPFSQFATDADQMQQYASRIDAVSSFWVATDSRGPGGYPSWHPYQAIGGPSEGVGAKPSRYGGARLTWAPATVSAQDTTKGPWISGGDSYLSWSAVNPDTTRAQHGYTEFIEVGFDTPVYASAIEVGENVGMGSVTKILMKPEGSSWQTMFTGVADQGRNGYFKDRQLFSHWRPSICEASYPTSRVRIELDTRAVTGWNEIDYVRLTGASVLKEGVLNVPEGQTSAQLFYRPDLNAHGLDNVTFRVCDCMYSEDRCSEPSTIAINIAPINDAPLLGVPQTTVRANCSRTTWSTFEFPHLDVDLDGLSFTILEAPSSNVLRLGFIHDGRATGGWWGDAYTLPVTIEGGDYHDSASASGHGGALKFERMDTTVRQFNFRVRVTDPSGAEDIEDIVLMCEDADPEPIGGIIGGSVGGAALIGALILYCYRRRSQEELRKVRAELEQFQDSVIGVRFCGDDWDPRTVDGVDWSAISQTLGITASSPEEFAVNASKELGIEFSSDQSLDARLSEINLMVFGPTDGGGGGGGKDNAAPAKPNVPLAPAQPSGPPMEQHRWYWQEDAGHLSKHDAAQIKDFDGTSFVAYAGSVCRELDAKLHDFIHYGGPKAVEVDLNDRIASTGTEQKVANAYTGVLFKIDFEGMTQTNTKSGFKRLVKKDKYAEAAPPLRTHASMAVVTMAARLKAKGKRSSSDPGATSEKKPDDLVEEDALILFRGQLLQISKQRPDGWAYGTVVYDEDMPSGRPPTGIDGLSNSAGWFPLERTEVANSKQLEALQKFLGGGGKAADTLKPPLTWDPMRDPMAAQLFMLPDADEKATVVATFIKTISAPSLSIVSVERVQNMSMWQSYAVKKQTVLMREEAADEEAAKQYERVWLFHGTDEETLPKIITQGFNRSFCGKNATMYGKGVYFARDADYSARTTYSRPNAQGIQHMFLCRVVVGVYCTGKKDALTPDVRKGHLLYDTTTNDMNNQAMFVTYHDAQAYPEYLVKFKQ